VPIPSTILLEGDIVFFSAPLESLTSVIATGDLTLTHQHQLLKVPSSSKNRVLVEVVIGHDSSLIGKTPKESKFRSKFGAAILAIHRRGKKMNDLIGTVRFEVGDTLLLETTPSFIIHHEHDLDFGLVSKVELEY